MSSPSASEGEILETHQPVSGNTLERKSGHWDDDRRGSSSSNSSFKPVNKHLDNAQGISRRSKSRSRSRSRSPSRRYPAYVPEHLKWREFLEERDSKRPGHPVYEARKRREERERERHDRRNHRSDRESDRRRKSYHDLDDPYSSSGYAHHESRRADRDRGRSRSPSGRDRRNSRERSRSRHRYDRHSERERSRSRHGYDKRGYDSSDSRRDRDGHRRSNDRDRLESSRSSYKSCGHRKDNGLRNRHRRHEHDHRDLRTDTASSSLPLNSFAAKPPERVNQQHTQSPASGLPANMDSEDHGQSLPVPVTEEDLYEVDFSELKRREREEEDARIEEGRKRRKLIKERFAEQDRLEREREEQQRAEKEHAEQEHTLASAVAAPADIDESESAFSTVQTDPNALSGGLKATADTLITSHDDEKKPPSDETLDTATKDEDDFDMFADLDTPPPTDARKVPSAAKTTADVEDDDDFDMFAGLDSPQPATADDATSAARTPTPAEDYVTDDIDSENWKPKPAKKIQPPTTRQTTGLERSNAQGYYQPALGELLNNRYVVDSHVPTGKGTFSVVIKARDRQTKSLVAIKIIREQTRYVASKEDEVIQKLNAADTLGRKTHIVAFFETFEFNNFPFLVFEWIDTSLTQLIKDPKRKAISLVDCQIYGQQLFEALDHLNKMGYIHKDIKPDNILVHSETKQLKLIDFGAAVRADDVQPKGTIDHGTPFYRPPEVFLGVPFTHALDMWSVGCTIFEMYTGQYFQGFHGSNPSMILLAIMESCGPISKSLIARSASNMPMLLDRYFTKDIPKRFKKPTSDGHVSLMVIPQQPGEMSIRKRILAASMGKDWDDNRGKLYKFIELLSKCLWLNPEKRIAPEDALQHSFFLPK